MRKLIQLFDLLDEKESSRYDGKIMEQLTIAAPFLEFKFPFS